MRKNKIQIKPPIKDDLEAIYRDLESAEEPPTTPSETPNESGAELEDFSDDKNFLESQESDLAQRGQAASNQASLDNLASNLKQKTMPSNINDNPRLRRAKPAKRWAKQFLAVAALIIFGFTAGTVLAWFYKNSTNNGDKPATELLSFEGPKEVASADLVTYKLGLKNQEASAMRAIEITLNLPPGFYLASSTPESEKVGSAVENVSTTAGTGGEERQTINKDSQVSPAAREGDEKDGQASPPVRGGDKEAQASPPVRGGDKEGVDVQANLSEGQRLVWKLAGLARGQTQEIVLNGQFFGAVGEKKTIIAELYYHLENFSSEFKESIARDSEITASLVQVKIDGPEKAVAGQVTDYTVKVFCEEAEKLSAKGGSASSGETKKLETRDANILESNTNDELPVTSDHDCLQLASSGQKSGQPLRLFIEYSSDFETEEVVPVPQKTDGEEYWFITELAEPYSVRLSGVFSGENVSYQELKARVGFYFGDKFILQTNASLISLLLEPKLDLGLKVNDLAAKDYPADWGEPLKYLITYKNGGEVDLKDVNLRLNFVGDLVFDLSSFACGQGSAAASSSDETGIQTNCDLTLAGGVIKSVNWNKDQLPDLAVLRAGASGEINFSANLIKNPSTSQKENYQNKAQVEAGLMLGDSNQGFKTQSDEVLVRLKSQLKLTEEARYFTDEYLKIGAGPLPPKVGEQTTYRIFLELENTSNALKDVVCAAILPAGVTWPNEIQTTLGEIKYEAAEAKVSWLIPVLESYTGDLTKKITSAKANFEVAIVPQASQRGQYVVLTQETVCRGQDSFAEVEVEDSHGYLTTELENDLGAMGKGIVE